MDMKSHKVEITKIIEADARGLYSTSMMKMPTTVKGFKQVVMQNFKLADGFEKLSGVGFYEIGKALVLWATSSPSSYLAALLLPPSSTKASNIAVVVATP